MAIPILIIGKSGSGKSCSLRNLAPRDVALVNVLGKPLPFRGKGFDQIVTDDYDKVNSAIARSKRDIVVVDDAGYLMTNMFMRGHSNAGAGNGVFNLYNTIGDQFWTLIERIRVLPGDKRVYVMMHEEQNDFGNVYPKTIGKMINEKVCLEGMFTIVLRCVVKGGKHIFLTQSDGMDVAKAPIGLFESEEIENDLAMVDKAICDYYEIGGKTNDQTAQ